MYYNVDKNSNNVTEDGYVIVGKFDPLGIARGSIDRKFGKISALRLSVHSESDNWAILSEVRFNFSYSKSLKWNAINY